MAPIKFEENIKDKLEKRILQPSEDAWAKLSAQLDTEDKKNTRSLFFYIGIAASIVGVLLVTTLFFKSSEEQSLLPTVVEINSKEKSQQSESLNSNTSESVVVTSNSNQIQKEGKSKEIEPQEKSSIKSERSVAAISEEKKQNQSNTNQPIIINETKVSLATSVQAKKEVIALNKLTFEEAKAIEVVEHIKKLEIEKGSVTDAEIEDLLKQAEKEILRQRIYNETTRTVDADALLQDVEDDLERSFRTRVFETLKSSYKTVKTAVAERNN